MFDALERQFQKDKYERPNLINELYQGTMKDYVKCLKVRRRIWERERAGGERERERKWVGQREKGGVGGREGRGSGRERGGEGEGERYERPIHCSSFLILRCYLHAVRLRECS